MLPNGIRGMQRGTKFVLLAFGIAFFHQNAIAQRLIASTYIGHPKDVASGGCGESILLESDGEQIGFASYGELTATAAKRTLRGDRVLLQFSPRIFFRGKATLDGLQIRGKLFVLNYQRHEIIVRPYTLRSDNNPRHINLSGLALSLTDSDGVGTYHRDPQGAVSFGMAWDTRKNFFNNLYIFTNRPSRRVFLNGGNSDASLNLNLPLKPGTHIFQFAGAPGADAGFFSLTLYFDNDPAKRISGFANFVGDAVLKPVPQGLETFDQYFGTQPSRGSLSLTNGGLSVTLTDLHFSPLGIDIVGGACAQQDGGADTTGGFTLRVVAEP
jgi:hypothetical protein